MDPIICKKHNVEKVAMRNKRNAPMLGCPVCHGKESEQKTAPVPKPEPKPEPATAQPKRSGGTLFSRLWGS